MFITNVGDFWGVPGTRDYMRARFATANALLQIHTIAAGELALAQFTDMMRLNFQSPFTIFGRLEGKGPFGDDAVATSNRAELRAVIGALRMYDWRSEGFDSIVVATDSSYVVEGATAWAKTWLSNGWVTQSGNAVMKRDLWELLLGEVERWSSRGLRVMLWRIPRELNVNADLAAKCGARCAPQPAFQDIFAEATVAVEEESEEEESMPMLGGLYVR
jgi:ribonuclease HI